MDPTAATAAAAAVYLTVYNKKADLFYFKFLNIQI